MNRWTKGMTGLILFCVMTVVIAMDVPVVRYCLCQDVVFLGVCECENEIVQSGSESCAAACSECCASVCAEEDDNEGDLGCVAELDFDLGEFSHLSLLDAVDVVEHGSAYPETEREASLVLRPLSSGVSFWQPCRIDFDVAPPSGWTVPLYLSGAVFLI